MQKETTMQIRIGGYQGAGSVHTAALVRFAAELEGAASFSVLRTDDVTAGGATARSLFAEIEDGAFHAGYIASSYLTARAPQLAVADLPFSVADRHSAYSALDGGAGAILREAVEAKTGYKVLGFWDNGFRHLTNGVRAIASAADCRGLVIRTLDNRIYRETLEAIGFAPLVTDVRELREAVTTGRVDAQENPLTNTVLFEIYHHHRYVSLTGHFFGIALFVCNAAWFSGLPEDAQKTVCAAAEAATNAQRRLAELQDIEALEVLRGNGVNILEAHRIDGESFRRASAAILEREAAKLDPRLVSAYLGR